MHLDLPIAGQEVGRADPMTSETEIGREGNEGQEDGGERGLGESVGNPVVGAPKRIRKERRNPEFWPGYGSSHMIFLVRKLLTTSFKYNNGVIVAQIDFLFKGGL